MLLIGIIATLFIGGLAAWLSEGRNKDWPKWISLLTILLSALLVIPLFSLEHTNVLLGSTNSPWLLIYEAPWIPRFGISFLIGLDGLSLLMVSLTIFLGLVALASSWNEIDHQPGFFQFNLLWTLAGVVGVFVALDLFLFFFFWEVMLIPMYLLIAIWGHEKKAYASMKFFLFTQVSGLLMLLSIVGLVFAAESLTGVLTFNYFDLVGIGISGDIAWWLMLGFFIAFVVKLPGFPFHTWLPDAHTQAPTAASVLLAGILLKTGAYGLIRFTVPLFPGAALEIAQFAMTLGAIGVVYGAIQAFAQDDFKRLVAYSSVSHMGFVLIGIYAWNELTLQGSVMQMVAHGLSTAALFMIAGALQHRLHTRDVRKMGGLWKDMPKMGAIAMFFIVASLGMPGLGNFVGEFLILMGAFQVNVPITVFASLGLITAAVYSLIAMQRVFQGAATPERSLKDFDGREVATMVLMMLGLVYLGIHPQPVFDLVEPTLQALYEFSGANPEWAGAAQ
ncbi:MAG: NADH-quinone oxidoreductase subunit M [Pseudomonadales bacterium]